MNISRKKFVGLFLVSAFAFMFISNALFGTEARVFPWNEQSFLGTDSEVAWKSVGYKICYPVKVILIGPFNNVFHDDPPPPLVAIVFALYWSILALLFHYVISRIKYSKQDSRL